MIAPDGAGFDLLHLLRHDAHIGGSIAALVAEAIEFETVVELDQRDDVVLEADVGTTPAAAAPTTAATTATAAADMSSAASAAAAADMASAPPPPLRAAFGPPPPEGRETCDAPRLPRLAWPRLEKSLAFGPSLRSKALPPGLLFGFALPRSGFWPCRAACFPERSLSPC